MGCYVQVHYTIFLNEFKFLPLFIYKRSYVQQRFKPDSNTYSGGNPIYTVVLDSFTEIFLMMSVEGTYRF